MSGGYYNYDQWRIINIASNIKQVIRDAEDKVLSEWSDGSLKWDFKNPQTLEEFRKAIHALTIAYVYAQRIDWLLSADDGEESFHARLKEDLDKAENNPDSFIY